MHKIVERSRTPMRFPPEDLDNGAAVVFWILAAGICWGCVIMLAVSACPACPPN